MHDIFGLLSLHMQCLDSEVHVYAKGQELTIRQNLKAKAKKEEKASSFSSTSLSSFGSTCVNIPL